MSEEDKFTTVTIPKDQIDMFTIENGDIENGDNNDAYWYTVKYIDDMCVPLNQIDATGYGLDYIHNNHEPINKTKAFRKDVESLLINIKRVSPAGSASFELAKDFMDTHYGEEG